LKPSKIYIFEVPATPNPAAKKASVPDSGI